MEDISGGVLTGSSIARAVRAGDIEIDPFSESRLNPASYDLSLGDKFAVYTNMVEMRDVTVRADADADAELRSRQSGHGISPRDWIRNPIDVREEQEVWTSEMSKDGFLLKPGIGYLMHTRERVRTDRYVPVLDGKSSIGRLFVAVHITAGYGDPGFDGQYTLEVTTVYPIVVYPGMRFCQIRFHAASGDIESYQKKGHYRNRLAEGPVPSMAWKQFEEEDSLAPSLVRGRRGARGR